MPMKRVTDEPLRPISHSSSSVTHEVVEETDNLPMYFSSPNRKWCCCCHKSGFTIPAHWHEYVEFIYVVKGTMSAVIQADQYELLPGDLLVINSGDLHMTRTGKGGSPYLLIQFSARRLRELFPEFELLHFNTCIRDREVRETPHLHESIHAMQELFDEGADGYQLLLTSRFYEFLHSLYKYHSTWMVSRSENTAGRDLKRVTDIVEWTQENFRQPLTLDDAAAHIGISREYFCRIFKKYTGQTFLEYLCTMRTTSLYEELRTSDLSIPMLMEKNGLTNYKTFLRTFRELYGTTPQKIRQGIA